MSRLTVFPDNAPDNVELDTEDGAVIAERMKEIGVTFERWTPKGILPKDADDKAVMEAYAEDIERIKKIGGYNTVDVVRLAPDNPKKKEARGKFLSEHIHAEDEVRFFVEGEGIFYLRTGGKLYMTLCSRGDLISVPAGVKHWFDMGPEPDFTCIRFFQTPEGWVAEFTGDDIAEKFPKFEKHLAA
ncbi:MAG: cupin domain-containing protein [Alphaproteobacteria bacterium]|nr:cupin domain-containing protein [Alphaproteobacteria bacterium]MCB9975895.1 cupin domain-containing protein [Rhodospirillales bacterium]